MIKRQIFSFDWPTTQIAGSVSGRDEGVIHFPVPGGCEHPSPPPGIVLPFLQRVLFEPFRHAGSNRLFRETIIAPNNCRRSFRLTARDAHRSDALAFLLQPCSRPLVVAGSAIARRAFRFFCSASQTNRVELFRSSVLPLKTDTAGNPSSLWRTLTASRAQAVGFLRPPLVAHFRRHRWTVSTVRDLAAVGKTRLALGTTWLRLSQAAAGTQASLPPPIEQSTHTDRVRIGRVRARHRRPSCRALRSSPRPGQSGSGLFGRDPRAGDQVNPRLSRVVA